MKGALITIPLDKGVRYTVQRYQSEFCIHLDAFPMAYFTEKAQAARDCLVRSLGKSLILLVRVCVFSTLTCTQLAESWD